LSESPIEQFDQSVQDETNKQRYEASAILRVEDGKEFLIDVENRELRDFDNPENVIKMHSQAGRLLISDQKIDLRMVNPNFKSETK
jgi:hypothetical protein